MVLTHTDSLGFNLDTGMRCLMILLAIATLIIPITYQPQEAEAIALIGTILIVGAFGLGGVVLHHVLNGCSECGKGGVGEAHRSTCPKGHVYYNCRANHSECASSS